MTGRGPDEASGAEVSATPAPVETVPAGPHRRGANDETLHRMELAISLVLRIGVLTSVVVVLAGLVLVLVHHPAYARLSNGPSYQYVIHHLAPPHTLSGLGRSVGRGTGRGLVMLGLAILILTPVLRVAVGVVSFGLERDLPMTLVTLFVLGVLIGSFILGGV